MFMPTKEDCDKIVEVNESFIKKEDVIDGVRVVQYNYMLCSLNDFTNPVAGEDIDAFELRGITFVEQSDGSWKRNLMLHKFFRISQTEGYMYDDVVDKEIVSIEEKADGSLISLVEVNGNVYAKSKFSFQSEQAKMAQEIWERDGFIRDFVAFCHFNNYSPIFELVSPANRVVVLYPETKLVLLQVRDNETGEYLNPLMYGDTFKINRAKPYPIKSLDECMEDMKIMTDFEGYIIKFSDGQFMKLKTEWYDSLHSVMTEDSSRVDYLINCTINETIDELISIIPEDYKDVRDNILHIQDVTVHFINHVVRHVQNCLVDVVDMERRDFAIKYKADPYFSIMMRNYTNPLDVDAIYATVKEFVLKNTRTKEMAERYFNEVMTFGWSV